MTPLRASPPCRWAGRVLVALVAATSLLASVPAGAASSLERGLGRPVAEQLEEEIGLVRDPALARWVEDVGSRIVKADGGNPQDYSFKILDADDVNAFAIPGGYVYVTMGLLRFVESEDELAAVIGHETAHVTSHHGMKQLKRDLLLTLGLALLRGHASELVTTLGQVGGVLYSLKHSRGDEAAADALGIRKVARSGYDPAAMVGFLRKLNEKEKDKPSRLEVYFMTHPPTAERLAKAGTYPDAGRKNLAVRRTVARGLADRGLYRQAIAVYEDVLAREPEDAALHLDVARCWDQLGRSERAREERERARALGAVLSSAPPPAAAMADGPPAPRAAVAAASARLVKAHQRLGADRDRRDRQAGELRREMGRRKREFGRLLRLLSTVASTVAPTDSVRGEMLHDIGLAVAKVEKAIGRVEATAEAGATVTGLLMDSGESLNNRLRARRVDPRLVAIAETFEPAATHAASDLDDGLGKCRQALKLVDTAIRLCNVAGREMLENNALPPPLLLTRFGQIRSRIQAAAGTASSALDTAEAAGHRADAAEARRRVLDLDLLGQSAPFGQQPALFALLTRRFGVPEAQTTTLGTGGAAFGQSSAGLLLGMAVRVRLKASGKGEAGSAADSRPVKPLTIDEGLERGVPLAPLNASLRILALDVARECKDGNVASAHATGETAQR